MAFVCLLITPASRHTTPSAREMTITFLTGHYPPFFSLQSSSLILSSSFTLGYYPTSHYLSAYYLIGLFCPNSLTLQVFSRFMFPSVISTRVFFPLGVSSSLVFFHLRVYALVHFLYNISLLSHYNPVFSLRLYFCRYIPYKLFEYLYFLPFPLLVFISASYL